MAFCFSLMARMARTRSRSMPARSYSNASAACCISLSSAAATSSVWPERKAATESATLRYSSGVTWPLQGATHLPM